ncbi:MAG: hypothetical protein ACR2MO_01730 [Acidimicrobiales bacterium]
MDSISFTAGITFNDNRAMTVDVTGIDATGIAYASEAGAGAVAWTDVKAVMLATTDHMLESGGSLLAIADVLRDAGDRADQAAEMSRFGLGVLQQAAPRVCPLGARCGLAPGYSAEP